MTKYDRDMLLDTVDSYVRNRVNACLEENSMVKREYEKYAEEDYRFLQTLLRLDGDSEEKGPAL